MLTHSKNCGTSEMQVGEMRPGGDAAGVSHFGTTAQRWLCVYRRPRGQGGLGFSHCGCAQFDDGSCVPESIYPEFARRRDQEKGSREFAKRDAYPDDMFPLEKLRVWPHGQLWAYVTSDVLAAYEANGGHPGDCLESTLGDK